MRGPIRGVEGYEDGDDEVGEKHESTAEEKEGPSAEFVHGPEGGEDAEELGDVEDSGHEELEGEGEAHCLEEGGAVVD